MRQIGALERLSFTCERGHREETEGKDSEWRGQDPQGLVSGELRVTETEGFG